jgi:hypothetical protein
MNPISRNMLGVLTAAMLLPACATVSAPDYPREHPANPEASPAPASDGSNVLDTYRPATARRPLTGPAATESHDGSGSPTVAPVSPPAENKHGDH